MDSGTHQVVSEHSILSAQRRDRDTAVGTPRRSKHCREALRHRLKQIGATGESDRSHDTKATTQSDFKVYDRGRSKTELTDSRRKCRNRRHHAPTRRSGRIDEVLEKLQDILEDFRSLKAEVLAESNKQTERTETEESERERDEIGGSSCVPWDVIAKPEGDEIGNDREQLPEQSMIESQREGDSPEDASSLAPDGGATVTEESLLIGLAEKSLSCVTGACDREEEEERDRRSRGDVKRILDDIGKENINVQSGRVVERSKLRINRVGE